MQTFTNCSYVVNANEHCIHLQLMSLLPNYYELYYCSHCEARTGVSRGYQGMKKEGFLQEAGEPNSNKTPRLFSKYD